MDKLYEGLKDLAEERRGKLDETLKLYQLQGEIDDLEHWIAEKEVKYLLFLDQSEKSPDSGLTTEK